jgi:hypothetical protein
MTTAHLPFGLGEWIVSPLTFSPAAINDAGLIVGEQNDQAVQYQNGAVQALQLNVAAGALSAAVDVSSLGAIAGKTTDPTAQAVLWWPLTWQLPAPPVGVFVPAAINKNLVIVGSALDAQVAFKWTPSAGYENLVAPGTLQPGPTFATDVNDLGYIVGFTEGPGVASPILWEGPDSVPHIPWPGASVRTNPHINNNGDVALVDGSQNVSILSLDGTIRSFPAIPDPQSVDDISDEGRLIGTSMVNGAKRGWTFYKDQLTWLDPSPSDPGTHVQPMSVNQCGNIVGQVLRGFTLRRRGQPTFVRGILFTKQFPFECDGGVVTRL